MLNEEGTLYKVSIEYNRLVNEKIDKIQSKLDLNRRNIEMFTGLIIKHKADVNNNLILQWALKTQTFNFKYLYTQDKINELYKNTVIVYNTDYQVEKDNYIHIINDYENDDLKVILKYYDNFRKCCILESVLEARMQQFKSYTLKSVTVRYMFKTIFMYCAIEMLKSKSYFQLPYNINLRVSGKTRPTENKKHKVDYGESFATLKAIAAEVKPDLLDDYNNGRIKYKAFIIAMSPYVYNKETNPTGKKWIVNDNKLFDFWVTIWTKYSKLKGIENYNIVPTKFVHPTKVVPRTHGRVMEMVKTIDGIINSNLIGFLNKVKILEKYHLSYCLKAFNHNIEI